MNDALNYLDAHRGGLFVLFMMLLGLAILVHYAMWVFGWGRFKTELMKTRQPLNFVFADAAIKIINDFRHLLALLIFLVFTGALGYALYIGHVPEKDQTAVDNLKESLQAVMATLGGLVGSIIGYYFGESSARSISGGNPSNVPTNQNILPGPPIQSPPTTTGTGITAAPAPPPAANATTPEANS